jgi:hypothetical protein
MHVLPLGEYQTIFMIEKQALYLNKLTCYRLKATGWQTPLSNFGNGAIIDVEEEVTG